MFLRNKLLSDFDVTLASKVMDGLDKDFTCNRDLIVSDIIMPYMDGVKSCKKIK